MRYKIGEVARILGISPDLIRYYEEKGVVSPTKDPYNNYRYYDTWDINYLIDCLWYKNFGFGIDQVAHMFSECTLDALLEKLGEKSGEIKASIRRQEMLLGRINKYFERLSAMKENIGKCDIRRNAEFVYYINRKNAEYDNRAELQELSRSWLKYMPFSRRFFEMPRRAAQDGGDSYSWGFSLGMQYAEEFGIEVAPPIAHMPPRICVHSFFKSEGKGKFSARHVDFMAEYADKNGRAVSGSAFGNLACSVIEDGKVTGYFEAWMPVDNR
ncbi:MAG: MerR family transcriptional regulator [Oscillospiraceae bacterium]|jgi:DNA-binding transcriptional MerR regulator|nr:MerR family transcriptional regulator [Oscillospiraceae bacterium]